jgi:hypothetical protein
MNMPVSWQMRQGIVSLFPVRFWFNDRKNPVDIKTKEYIAFVPASCRICKKTFFIFP